MLREGHAAVVQAGEDMRYPRMEQGFREAGEVSAFPRLMAHRQMQMSSGYIQAG
jgi:hypothetical protein